MRKVDYKLLDALMDNVDNLFGGLKSTKDRKFIATEVCKYVASMCIEEGAKDTDVLSNCFSPVGVLERAKKELTEAIDRELLDVIGQEVVNYALTHKENE